MNHGKTWRVVRLLILLKFHDIANRSLKIDGRNLKEMTGAHWSESGMTPKY
jgi:hypothetical protein